MKLGQNNKVNDDQQQSQKRLDGYNESSSYISITGDLILGNKAYNVPKDAAPETLKLLAEFQEEKTVSPENEQAILDYIKKKEENEKEIVEALAKSNKPTSVLISGGHTVFGSFISFAPDNSTKDDEDNINGLSTTKF